MCNVGQQRRIDLIQCSRTIKWYISCVLKHTSPWSTLSKKRTNIVKGRTSVLLEATHNHKLFCFVRAQSQTVNRDMRWQETGEQICVISPCRVSRRVDNPTTNPAVEVRHFPCISMWLAIMCLLPNRLHHIVFQFPWLFSKEMLCICGDYVLLSRCFAMSILSQKNTEQDLIQWTSLKVRSFRSVYLTRK